MTAPGHILLATAIVGITEYIFHIPVNVYFLAGIALGAVLPDIDEPKSLIGRKLAPLAFLLRMFRLKHRTLSHSIIFALILIIPSIFLPYPFNLFGIGAGIGSVLHCVGDLLTISGLKYFLYPKKVELHLLPKNLRFRTGGAVEQIIIFGLVGINYLIYKELHLIDVLGNFHGTALHLPHLLESGYNYFFHLVNHH